MKDDGPRCFVRPSPQHRSVGLDGVAVLQRVGDRVQGVVHTLSVVIPDYPCSAPDEECRAAGSPHVTGEQCLRQPVGLRGVEQIGPCDGAVATVLGGQLFEEAAPSIRHPWRPPGRPEPKARAQGPHRRRASPRLRTLRDFYPGASSLARSKLHRSAAARDDGRRWRLTRPRQGRSMNSLR